MVEVLLAAVAADEARRVQVRRQFGDDDEHLVAIVEGGLRELEEVRELVAGLPGQLLQRRVLLLELLLEDGIECVAVRGVCHAGGDQHLLDNVGGAVGVDAVLFGGLAAPAGGRAVDAKTLDALGEDREAVLRVAVGDGGLVGLQLLDDDTHGLLAVKDFVEAVANMFEQEADDGEPLIEAGHLRTLDDLLGDVAGEDLVDLVVGLVFVVKVVVDRELFRNAVVLQVLLHKVHGHGELVLLIEVDDVGEVLPATSRDEGLAVDGGLDEVEVRVLDGQVRRDGRVHLGLVGVFFPGREVGLDVDSLETVPGDDVELPDRVVVLGRVTGRDDDPAVGDLVHAEGLELQELQHGGREGLGDAVDLVEEQDAFLLPCLLHLFIHGGDDLGHGVFGHPDILSAVDLVRDERKAQGTLTGVVGHGVGDEGNVQFGRDLPHDGGLADAGRAHQEDGTLPFDRDDVIADLIAGQVRSDREFDLFFGFTDIHTKSSSSSTNLMAHGGTSGS